MKIKTLLVYLSIAVVIAYTIWVVFFPYDPVLENTLLSLGITSLHVFLTIFCFYLVYQKTIDFRIRRCWLFLGLATLSNIIAISIYYYIFTFLGIDPFPSIGDFFYLLFYPLTLAGVLSLPHKTFKRMENLIFIFDFSIVMLTVVMIFWYFILAPMHLSSEGGWKGIIAIAYPIGDLLLFAAGVTLILRKAEKIPSWTSIFIVSGMLFSAVPDYYFYYFKANDIPYSVTTLNIFWIISVLCMLLAIHKQMDVVNKPIPVSVVSDRPRRLLSLTLPYLAAMTGPVLLAAVINSSKLYDMQLQGLLYGTIILTGLVLGRQQIIIIDNNKLYEETRKLAVTDSLTGVHNRHYFNQVFQQEIERSYRYKRIFSVLLIDVDNFKMINDTFGHLKGDTVLKMIASSLKKEVRQTNILARFGGDEFAVILPETDINSAHAVAQKIEKTVGSCSFANLPLSVSIGAASFLPDLSPEQFLEEADRQLYKNKLEKNPQRNIAASVLFV